MRTQRDIRREAFRAFGLGLVGVSAFASIGLYAFVYSPTVPLGSEIARWGVLVAISAASLAAAVSLVATLRRDLTPVAFTPTGLSARNRFVAYGLIASIDPMTGKAIFSVRLKSGKRLYLSKIGFDTEDVFLHELEVRHLSLESAAERGQRATRQP